MSNYGAQNGSQEETWQAGWEVSGLSRLPDRKEFKRWVPKLQGVLHEVEHYRLYQDGVMEVEYKGRKAALLLGPPRGNLAVVILKDGRAFVGKSLCSPNDQYSSRRGFAVAMGRALKKATLAITIPSPRLSQVDQRPRDYVGILSKAAEEDLMKFWDGDFTVPVGVGGVELRDVCRERLGL